MMVNQFDFTTKIKVRMILDTEDSALVSKETLLEEGIRIAASLALQLVKPGYGKADRRDSSCIYKSWINIKCYPLGTYFPILFPEEKIMPDDFHLIRFQLKNGRNIRRHE